MEKDKIREIIDSNRYIEKIYPSPEFLEEQLRNKRQLSVYFGFDPTAPDLHLGHTTNLFVLKKFQESGYKVVIVIGDFTARIGDPTGKDESRRPLTEKEIKENSKTYKQQIGKILDLKKTEFKQNSKWLDKISLKEFVKIASNVTVQQLLHRDMFQKRIKEEAPIAQHEFIYPLLQGYDSVAMNIDGEIGGTDQTFNMLIGRILMDKILKKEKFVITTKLLENPLTGKKLMSKSEGNYVSLQDPPFDMYSKIMALPDEVIFPCLELCTEVPLERINSLKSENILEAKRELAFEITKIYHGEREAEKSQDEFSRVFKKKELPERIEEFEIGRDKINILDLLVKLNLASSKSDAKRLIIEGAVEVGGKRVGDWREDLGLEDGVVVKVGPRRFAKVKLQT